MSRTDFNDFRESYADDVQRSIDFSGLPHEFFTEAKVDHLLRLIRTHLAAPNSSRVLDVGCGIGVTHGRLRDHVGELHGVDIADDALEIARERHPQVHYQSYQGTQLPYRDGHFDLCFTICVLHHVAPADWPAFLREMARVTRPGGLIAVFEHNPYNPLTRRAVSCCRFDKDAVLLPQRRTRALFRDLALPILESRFILFLPFRGRLVSLIERGLSWLPLGAQYFVAARKRGGLR